MAAQSSGCGTALLIAAAVIGGGYWFVSQYNDMTILNRAGSHPVSDALKDHAEARPLSTKAKSIPGFISGQERLTKRSRVQATGFWTYVVETNRGTFTMSDAFLEHTGEQSDLRIERSFREQWFRTLQHSGYFSTSKRPPHMQIRSFAITTPEGVRFEIEKSRNAAQVLVNLAAIIGCKEFDGEPELLMTAARDSLAHAVIFSGLNEKLSLQEKLRLSCDPNPQVRECAAEMLASHLPRFPTVGSSAAFNARDYRGVIVKLSRQVPLAQKERAFRAAAAVKPPAPRLPR